MILCAVCARLWASRVARQGAVVLPGRFQAGLANASPFPPFDRGEDDVMLHRKVVAGLVVAGAVGLAGLTPARADEPLSVSPAVYRAGDELSGGARVQLVHRGYGWGGGWGGGYGWGRGIPRLLRRPPDRRLCAGVSPLSRLRLSGLYRTRLCGPGLWISCGGVSRIRLSGIWPRLLVTFRTADGNSAREGGTQCVLSCRARPGFRPPALL
jgi:hypothetical protein